MKATIFADAELICFYHDIITIIRSIKNQYQRADINSIHKKIIKIPDCHDVSKEFLNIRMENYLKKGRITNKSTRGNPYCLIETINFFALFCKTFLDA